MHNWKTKILQKYRTTSPKTNPPTLRKLPSNFEKKVNLRIPFSRSHRPPIAVQKTAMPTRA